MAVRRNRYPLEADQTVGVQHPAPLCGLFSIINLTQPLLIRSCARAWESRHAAAGATGAVSNSGDQDGADQSEQEACDRA